MSTMIRVAISLSAAIYVVLSTPIVHGALSIQGGQFECTIYPSAEADIGSTVAGVLEKISVDRSDAVEQGDVLAVLESTVERANVALASARALAAAEIVFGYTSSSHSESQLAQKRNTTYGSAISKQEVDNREAEDEFAQIQLNQALHSQNIMDLELAHAKAKLSQKTIRSPYSGIVIERYLSVGEHVNDEPILKIAQIDPLHIETSLPAVHLGAVQPGMLATISTVDNLDNRWKATVDRVDAIVDIATGTFGVRLSLPNPDREIVAGTRCEVSFSDNKPDVNSDSIEEGEKLRAETSTVTVSARSKKQFGSDNSTAALTLGNIDIGIDEVLANIDTLSSGPDVGNEQQCVESTFFNDRDSAIRRASELRSQSIDVVIAMKKEVRRKGFKVLSPSLQTQKAVDSYVSQLKSTGVTDYYAKVDTLPGRVAVGAFVELKGAQSVIDRLAENEIPALLFPWEESMDTFYLKPGHQDIRMCE